MNPEIPHEARLAAVEKVLSSVAFARAEQLRRLLRWLGERAIADASVPSEQEVAIIALGKPETFDPQTDSLVRKEMSRLRAKLRQYYSSDGAGDPVRVQNNDGYRLTFDLTRPAFHSAVDQLARPCLMVAPIRAAKGLGDLADHFGEELLVALASAERFELMSPAGAAAAFSLGHAKSQGVDHLVEGSLRAKGDSLLATLWLVDCHNGRARRLYRLSEAEVEVLAGRAAALLCHDILPLPVAPVPNGSGTTSQNSPGTCASHPAQSVPE